MYSLQKGNRRQNAGIALDMAALNSNAGGESRAMLNLSELQEEPIRGNHLWCQNTQSAFQVPVLLLYSSSHDAALTKSAAGIPVDSFALGHKFRASSRRVSQARSGSVDLLALKMPSHQHF